MTDGPPPNADADRVFDAVMAQPLKIAELVIDTATHHELAQAYLNELSMNSAAPPVACDNALWLPDKRGLWVPTGIDALAVAIGRTFNKHKHCKKVSDYRGVASHLMALVDDPGFFAGAPVGVVCPSGFHTIEGGRRTFVPLKAEHRQRYALAVDADFELEPVLFSGFLAQCFPDDAEGEQADLAAEFIGCALTGSIRQKQAALLMLGPGGAGKSVLQTVMQAMFPPSAVVSVTPYSWGHEYYCAGLAGARLNVVGEMPDDQPIPAAAFKQVLGGDLVSGRHPNHRPFSFIPSCGHLFNSNTQPATLDRSEAFFRRWRVLHFKQAVPPERRDPDLAEKIITAELGAVVAWALLGAERAALTGKLRTTAAHDAVLRRWRIGSNPVLLFLTDPDYCEIDPDAQSGATDTYTTYRSWAQVNGNRPMSRQKFNQLVDDTAGGFGVYRDRSSGERYVRGLRLVSALGGITK